jgi:hypothetical protein
MSNLDKYPRQLASIDGLSSRIFKVVVVFHSIYANIMFGNVIERLNVPSSFVEAPRMATSFCKL